MLASVWRPSSTLAVWMLTCPLLCFAGCGGEHGGSADGGAPKAGTFRCAGCLSAADCGGDSCVQYGLDVACAPPCGSNGSCASGSHCAAYSTVSGQQAMVCVPDTPACGMNPVDAGGPATTPDAGPGGTHDAGQSMPTSCGGLVAPSVSACCHCSSGHTCGPNNCYGGWWCNTASCRCQAPPTNCGTPDAGPGSGQDAGAPPPPPTGTVNANGGTVSRLFFAVIGDTRPAMEDDTSNYPTTIITREYRDLQNMSPRPQFAVSTGDYVFASPSHYPHQAGPQMNLYLGARAGYSGTVFYAMGNHECTGATRSNCGPGTTDGNTDNYTKFMSLMLGQIHKTEPYYMVRINATDGSWTSKIVVAAPNAWTSTQASWFRTTMAIPTTYTFVVRHEPTGTYNAPPGLAPMDTILSSSNYTLLLVGHTHTYYHGRTSNEVTMGLGGAPPSGSYDYGYLTVTQLASGNIEVREIGYMSGTVNDTFRVTPNGTVL